MKFLFISLVIIIVIIMSVVAPTQDLLIRIKNAYMSRKEVVDWIVHSKFLEAIVDLLKKYKFVREFTVREENNKKFIKIYLHEVVNPVQDIPVVRLFSKPSRRWYVSYKDLRPVAGGRGIGIISTSKWLLPTHVAKKLKVGGELIAEIY